MSVVSGMSRQTGQRIPAKLSWKQILVLPFRLPVSEKDAIVPCCQVTTKIPFLKRDLFQITPNIQLWRCITCTPKDTKMLVKSTLN